jgi:hypothetical protein
MTSRIYQETGADARGLAGRRCLTHSEDETYA